VRFNQPRAYLLTWTAYGTHLHGDERGSVNRKGVTLSGKFLGPDEIFERLEQSQLKFPPFAIDAHARRVLRLALVDACAFRKWPLMCWNIRREHVHVVVGAATSSDKTLQVLKARTTRTLREAKLVDVNRPVWTEGGSRRELYLAGDVDAAIRYVVQGQGEDLPEA
jgi:REP element-mobilizing transposase RayT